MLISAAMEIAQDCKILSSSQFQICGTDSPFSRPKNLNSDWRTTAIDEIAAQIYKVFHLRQSIDQNEETRIPVLKLLAHREFEVLLAASCANRYWWSPGWQHDGKKTLSNGRVKLKVTADDMRITGRGIDVRLSVGHPYVSAGFYLAISECGPPLHHADGHIRLYLNVDAPDAPKVFRAIQTFMAEYRVRGITKVLNHPERFDRSDSCVVFIDRISWNSIKSAFTKLVSSFPLKPKTSAFSLRITDGFSIAEEIEEPKKRTIRSFGESCARLASEGIVQAYMNNPHCNADDRSAAIDHAFAKLGFSSKTKNIVSTDKSALKA